ncbi:MAG: hypothetical protein R2991_09500 [Thermoanaerobaculia bacterium]
MRRPVFLLLLAAGAAFAASSVREIELPRLNQTYRDLAPDLLPVESGALTVTLHSESNQLTLRSHSLRIEPLPTGDYRMTARASLLGKALVTASVQAGGLPGEIEDEILLPPQDVVVRGRASVRRVEGGYEITPLELPETLDLRIQSRLARQIVSTCETLSILLSGMECAGFERGLSVVRLPLPEPGNPQILDAGYLTAEEQAQIDAALGL